MNNKNILTCLIFSFIFLIIFGNLLLKEGSIEYGDFTVPDSVDKYVNLYFYTWNDHGSYSTFQYLPRLSLYGPILYIFYIFDMRMNIVTKFLAITPIIISFLSMYISSKIFIRKIFLDNNEYFLIPLVVSLIYALNPWIISETRHFSLIWGYSFIPLIIILSLDIVDINEDFTFKKSFILSLLLTFSSITPQWLIFNTILLLLLIIYNLAISISKIRLFIRVSANLLMLVIILLLINFFWLFPVLVSGQNRSITSPDYILTIEDVSMLSRNADLANTIRLINDWWPQVPWNLDMNMWNYASFILPIFAFSSLLFKYNKYRSFFLILLITFIIFGTGNNYFSDIYNLFVVNLPIINWTFRNPSRWSALIAVCYSFLSIYTLYSIKNIHMNEKIMNKNYIYILSIILVLSLFGLYTYPTINGYINKVIDPIEIPYEYYVMNLILEKDNSSSSIFWLPEYRGYPTYWSKDHLISQFDAMSSPKSTINTFTPLSTYYIRYVYDKIYVNESFFNKYMQILSSRYIVFHDDIPETHTKDYISLNNIMANNEVLFLKNEGFIYSFELPIYADKINIPKKNIFISGGMDNFGKLNSVRSFTPINFSISFLDQNKYRYDYIVNADHIIVEDQNDMILSFVNDTDIISPFDNIYNYDPSKVWSKGRIMELYPYLNKISIENRQFDNGKGFVFTGSNYIIGKDPSIYPKYIYDFENNITGWNVSNENIQSMELSDNAYTGKKSLRSVLNKSTWGWKIIYSPLVAINYTDIYRWKFHINGENVQRAHSKIIEYDTDKKVINEEYVALIGVGTFEWKDISIDYKPIDKRTVYIQFQIWHGHNTIQPLPNKIWIDDVKIYDITKYTKPVALDMDVNINNGDDYELFIRYLKNEEGGRINISLDGKLINSIDTYDQLNKFEWKKIDTLKLRNGKYRLTLTNVEGFNAVNIFALIPKEEYEKVQERTDSLLAGKRLIYIFEAESDLYRDNVSISEKYESSGREVVEFQENSTVWQNISILRSDNYKMALKINGSFDVKVDDIIYGVSSNMSDFVYIGPMYLNKGNHKIDIQGNNSDLDVIWLYSANNVSKKIESKIISNITIPIIKPTGREIAIKTDKRRGFIPINQSPGSVIEINEGDNITWFNEEVIPVTFVSDIPEFGARFLDYGKRISYMFARQGSYHLYFKENKNFNVTVIVKSLYKTSDNDTDIDSSVDNSEKLEDIFTTKEIPATVTNYTKINPTLYYAKINATKPFMLSFAESYDPLWTVKIDGINGKSVKSEIIRPIPLYSVVNGFWINQIGDLDITIEYEPQRWFYIGAAISIATLIICIGYLIYDWRRKRNE